MAQDGKKSKIQVLKHLREHNYLFKSLDNDLLGNLFKPRQFTIEKLYSNRPIYTAFREDFVLEHLYAVIDGGPIIMRSTPLDRIIAITYPRNCFGVRSLDFGFRKTYHAFPSLVEAYKTADVIKIPLEIIKTLYQESETFRERYLFLLELREKFQYHLLNCSTYPPQAVASLLRALIYQERKLGNQPQDNNIFVFDLSVDVIARTCQLNHRTVEQVIKAMTQVGLLEKNRPTDISKDLIRIANPEELKQVYGATRDKVSWWPLR
ncbi:MAG: Crp/Fnr family transcriptional regulator [Xenococcaceae cyanobacterium MO_167.B27]|nr:Crp/Fnr family transcriptional regulator [Xenococcaceae cyanobacterium MO_167.B27]